MTHHETINNFSLETKCSYKEEKYSVRDNGAILRHSRDGKRSRKDDNQWTFGKPNPKTGYMDIGTERIHRIVATAFHGIPPTKEHVVDHVDTNKRNNRPENLRWVTRLENVLLNPITAKRIALVCGSVEAFLADPSKFRDKFQEPNYEWMCIVTAKEAQLSLERMLSWARSDKRSHSGSLDKWIFNRTTLQNHSIEVSDTVKAKTSNAIQRNNWRVPSEFPCCPQEYNEESIVAYAEKLKLGTVFCRNDTYTSLVLKSAISDNRQSLYVMTKSEGDAVKPWALAEVTYENGLFVHTNCHNFFTQEGAEKQFTLAQGLEWTGEDSIDDYC